MLITTCTHCLARFRVTPEQLNARQGQVRCGRCNQVFSGFEALERFPDDDTGARLLAAREASARTQSPTEAAAAAAAAALPHVQSVDEPPASAEPPPAPSAPPATPQSADAEPAAPRDEPGYVEPAATPSTPYRAAPRKPLPVVDYHDTDPVPRRRPSRWWSAGVALMLLVLAAESAYALRGEIALSYPAARPWLEKACVQVGCAVPWPRNEQLLKLEDSELLEVPGHPGEISLVARLRNLASVAQEYPCIELTLTDLTGQAAARRVLRPADYLGHAPAASEAFAAGSELALQLRLATPRIRPTGYQLLLFYP